MIIHAEGVLVQKKGAGIIIHAEGVRGGFTSSAPQTRVRAALSWASGRKRGVRSFGVDVENTPG
jgi:hypothetical protein